MKGAGSVFSTIFLGLVLGALVWLGAYWVFKWGSFAPQGFAPIIAVPMLVVSLALPGKPGVISNGLLVGAVVAMLSAVGLMWFYTLLIVGFADDAQRSFVAVGSLVLANVLMLVIVAGYVWLREKKDQAAGDMEKVQDARVQSDSTAALTIAGQPGGQAGAASAYHRFGGLARSDGDVEQARAWYIKSLAITERLGDQAGMVSAYRELGALAYDDGDLEQARAWYTKALGIRERLGNPREVMWTCWRLGQWTRMRRGSRTRSAGMSGRWSLCGVGGGRPVRCSMLRVG